MKTNHKGFGIPAIIAVVAIFLLLAIGGFFLMGRSKTSEVTEEEVVEEEMTEPTHDVSQNEMMQNESTAGAEMDQATGSAAQGQVIEVTTSSFKFNPTQIRVKVNQPVTIKLNNTQGIHNFAIDEFNVKTKVVNGVGTDTVTFTPTKKGTFEYYCSVGNHRQMGMVGSLIVE